MSKKQKQRTKGNVRPSSSGRAAELLAREGGGHVGFVGFGSMSGDLGYVPTSLGFEDQDAELDGDFRMVLRKLTKRDVVTKLKAIQEFQGLCAEKEEDTVISMLPHWPRLYNRLCMDHDKRVREASQQAFCKVVQRVGRNLAPQLKAIMGCWLMAQNDPFVPAASAARAAFSEAFPGQEKRANAAVFCKAEVLQLYKDNLFKETAQTLSDPKSFSKEEQEEKYLRVVSSSLLALKEFVNLLPEAQHKSTEEELITILSEDRLWKYAKHKSPLIRGALYSFVGALCKTLPCILPPFMPRLAPSLLHSMDECDPATVGPVWDAILRLISSHQDLVWKHVNVSKAVLPKLWSILRQGGNGLADIIYPHLLPLLSHLPPEVKGQGASFYDQFFNNFRNGFSSKHVTVQGRENVAVLKSFTECLRYCLAQHLTDEECDIEVQRHLIDQQFMPLLKSCLAEETKSWSVVTIFQQTAVLLNYLSKQPSSTENRSPAHTILDTLWASISEICMSHLTTVDDSLPLALNRIGEFMAILKNPTASQASKTQAQTAKRPKPSKVKFAQKEEERKKDDDEEEEEEEEEDMKAAKEDDGAANSKPEAEPTTPPPPSISHPQLTSLVCKLVQTSFTQARGSASSLLHLHFLGQLVRTFPNKATIQTMLLAASVNAPPHDREGMEPTRDVAAADSASTVSPQESEGVGLLSKDAETPPSVHNAPQSSSMEVNERTSMEATGDHTSEGFEDRAVENPSSRESETLATISAPDERLSPSRTKPTPRMAEGVRTKTDTMLTDIATTNPLLEDAIPDDDQLPLRCIYLLLLPWLLDVERSEALDEKERSVHLDVIVDMTISILSVLDKENRCLVVDAICLKAQTPELLYAVIIKMRCNVDLAVTMETWLQTDVFGEKLLSIQDDLCRLTLGGQEGRSSVGWKLITLALTSGKNDEPLIGTTHAELLLVGFYHALTRPDVVTTATQCIRFICDITSNFFSAVKGCVHLRSSSDLLLALFQLECREAHNLSGSLKEKVHSTWVGGVQSLVKQTGALLTEQGLLVKTTQWIKQALSDREGNMLIHIKCDQLGLAAASFLTAILDGLPSNSDSSLDVGRSLLELLLPTQREWEASMGVLPNQWMAPTVIGQQMTFGDLQPLTFADNSTQPQALNMAAFVSTLVTELLESKTHRGGDMLGEDAAEGEAVSMATSWLPWECDILQASILEVLYTREWCHAMMGVQDVKSDESNSRTSTKIITPPAYINQQVPVLNRALDAVWPQLNRPHWQQMVNKILDRSLSSGALWAQVLDSFLQTNSSLTDREARLNMWSLCDAAGRQWYELVDLQMVQTLEKLVPHFSESERHELAEVHTAMLVSAEEERITSICGAIGNLTIVVRCSSLGLDDKTGDLALGALRQLQNWRERFNSIFIFSLEELEGAPSELLCANTKMIQLLTCLVEEIPEHLESHDWDFILCSLVSWIQACFENIGLANSSIPISTLCAVTSDLLTSAAKLLGNAEPHVTLPPNLMTEWTEFFSDGAYSVFLPAFIQFIESESSRMKSGVDVTPLLLSLCEAASHMPAEQLKGHRLATRLQPGSSRHVPDTMHSLVNHLTPLLTKPHRAVQLAAYNMLERVMPEFANYDEEYVQVRNKTEDCDEDESPSIAPPTGLHKLLDSSTALMQALLLGIPVGECTLIEPDSEAEAHTRCYLLAWRLYLTVFRAASMEVRAQYSSYLKQSKGISLLLDHIFCLIPEDPSLGPDQASSPGKGSPVNMFTKPIQLSPKASPGVENEVQHLSCSVFYSILKNVPVIARQWCNLQDRRIGPFVDKFTTKFVSPLLCAEEIQSVQANPSEDENLSVKARLSTREVIATYTMQDLSIEMMITLPTNHPLGPIEVDNRKKVAVGTSQWRQWTLMLTTFLTHQNGSIMEGLALWKSNADKRFEGIEDCMICFSVIHGGNCSLPKLTCKTCKKKYHSACLYKWFSTSSQSSCPLCRSPF